jgi:glycosyltransferase involved in cell wall biosynthesis
VTLATHIRNREALERSGAPLPNTEVIYIDTEWFAGPLYKTAKILFPRSEHSVFLLSSLDFFAYDNSLYRELRERMSKGQSWDVVHMVTPVSPSAFTRLPALGMPVVRGPLNGGIQTTKQFPELMKADSSWLYPLRSITKPVRSAFAGRVSGDVVLVATRATRESLTDAERAVARSMTEIAVDPERYAATEWPAAPSRDNPLRVVFVGRLIPAKALSLLIEAVKQLQTSGFPVELTVIGDGPMSRPWKKQAHELGTAVRFLGAQGAAEVVKQIQLSHLLCLPSVRESGGAVLLEAMSCARPVVGIAQGGPAEIISPEVGQLVAPESSRAVVEGLVQCLKDVFANPDEWRERGRRGREVAIARHSWDAHVIEMLEIYNEVAAGVAAGAIQ